MTHRYQFRSTRIDPETVDELAEEMGCESRSEYFRLLIRRHAEETDTPL